MCRISQLERLFEYRHVHKFKRSQLNRSFWNCNIAHLARKVLRKWNWVVQMRGGLIRGPAIPRQSELNAYYRAPRRWSIPRRVTFFTVLSHSLLSPLQYIPYSHAIGCNFQLESKSQKKSRFSSFENHFSLKPAKPILSLFNIRNGSTVETTISSNSQFWNKLFDMHFQNEFIAGWFAEAGTILSRGRSKTL